MPLSAICHKYLVTVGPVSYPSTPRTVHMATVMEFSTPTDEFPLGSVFETLPGVTVELERVVPHERLTVPYFWVRGAEAEDIEAAFTAHAGVVSIELIDDIDNEYLMRVEWASGYFGILNALARAKVVVLSGVGRKDGWSFEVRGESREAISAFRTNCQEHGIDIEITAVYELLPVQNGNYGLTDTQRTTLVLAYERGYFDTPRGASLQDLADELDITSQSVSARLRRGYRRLIGATLVTA